MSSIGGRKARVMYGSYLISGIGDFNMSGLEPEFLDDTSFGDTVKKVKRAGIDDAGTVSFSGNYDPDDTNGQVALNALSQIDSGLTNLYFYELYAGGAGNDKYAFWRVKSGGEIFLHPFNAIKMAKNALGTISFTGKISGQPMERVAN